MTVMKAEQGSLLGAREERDNSQRERGGGKRESKRGEGGSEMREITRGRR